jgi:hypothetical protein
VPAHRWMCKPSGCLCAPWQLAEERGGAAAEGRKHRVAALHIWCRVLRVYGVPEGSRASGS